MLTSLLLAWKPCSSLRISRLPLNRVKYGSRGPTNDNLLRLVTTTSEEEIKVFPKKDGCEIDLSLSALSTVGITLDVSEEVQMREYYRRVHVTIISHIFLHTSYHIGP